MHLDDMTGLELAQRIGKDTQLKSLGFILISSSMATQKLSHTMPGMGITLLAKPFDEHQLSNVLREAIISNSGPK
jgi:CheY-like chemotaxis protein